MVLYLVIDYDPSRTLAFHAKHDEAAIRKFRRDYAARIQATLIRIDATNPHKKPKTTALATFGDGEFFDLRTTK
jgi:hypothetical protein